MKYGSQAWWHLLLARDFGACIAVIWLVSLKIPVHHGSVFFTISLMAAAVATLDLAFLRHLRRVYASPRRGVWRRG